MTGVPDDVVDALAGPVAAAISVIASRIPPVPTAQAGRTGAPATVVQGRLRQPSLHLFAERLLGALELTIPGLDLADAPDLSPYLGRPPARIGFARNMNDSDAVAAAALAGRFRPGVQELVNGLSRRLAGHPRIAPLLAIPAPSGTGDGAEESVAAAHGAAYLALTVAVASVVMARVRTVPGPAGFTVPAAAVGLGLAAALTLLSEVPMPDSYAAALLEKTRAEYLLPRTAVGKTPAAGYRFTLAEGRSPDTADFSGNGLVAVVPGGAVIRTGTEHGPVRVAVRVYAEAPPLRAAWWDEIVEVSWHAERGQASVTGPDKREPADARLRQVTPPWPGDYRLRVCATGRDDADDEEDYELAVWQAPPAPETVHKRTDRLGHRLRGEPEPPVPAAPEREYRWIRKTRLELAATITVVTGASPEEVLAAFGADPGHPEKLTDDNGGIRGDVYAEAWVSVLDTATAVLAVEYNGFRGTDRDVLSRASAGGRAASFMWNAKAMTNLAFAENGRLLASYEPLGTQTEDHGPAVMAALEGLDFEDVRNHDEKGLVAVERFTGCGITPGDLARIEEADIAYRVPEI